MNTNGPTTHFGYQEVPTGEKAGRVRGVFDSVADNYDLMNDLMSGGLHRLWKRFTLAKTGLRPGDLALDVAGGTADLTASMSRQVGDAGLVCLTDINANMLDRGRRRLVNDAIVGNVVFAAATVTDRQRAMSWAQRLRRVFAIDVETCRHCGGRLRVIASIEQPAVIERILAHLGRDAGSVDPAHPSRAPPQGDRLV
jgi:hypothetical protein